MQIKTPTILQMEAKEITVLNILQFAFKKNIPDLLKIIWVGAIATLLGLLIFYSLPLALVAIANHPRHSNKCDRALVGWAK